MEVLTDDTDERSVPEKQDVVQIINSGSKGDPEDLYVRLNLVTQ